MITLISEIMEKDVYACHVSSTIGDVLRILVDKKVSGVPIINDEQHVVGFISDGDIMKYIGKENPRTIGLSSYMIVLYDETPFNQKIEDMIGLNVMRLATTKVISVNADWQIDEVANLLGTKKIKKAPVLEDGKLVGIVSRSEITRYIVGLYLKK